MGKMNGVEPEVKRKMKGVEPEAKRKIKGVGPEAKRKIKGLEPETKRSSGKPLSRLLTLIEASADDKMTGRTPMQRNRFCFKCGLFSVIVSQLSYDR